MCCRKSVGPRMEPWGIPALFLRLLIQNYLKLSISEKRRSKARYLTWNSLRLKFVKKTLDISSATTRVAPHLLNALVILSAILTRNSGPGSSFHSSQKTLNIHQGSNQAYRNHKIQSTFSLSQCERNLILLFPQYKALCQTKNTQVNSIYIVARSCF